MVTNVLCDVGQVRTGMESGCWWYGVLTEGHERGEKKRRKFVPYLCRFLVLDWDGVSFFDSGLFVVIL